MNKNIMATPISEETLLIVHIPGFDSSKQPRTDISRKAHVKAVKGVKS